MGQRREHAGGFDTSQSFRFEQKPRVTRVHREGQHLPSEIRDVALMIQCPEILEQFPGPLQSARLGRFEPAEFFEISDPRRFERKHHLGQIEPLHLGQLGLRPLLVIFFHPQAHAASGRGASGTAGPLVGGGAADFFDQQSIDPAPRIIARDAGQPAVDHQRHTLDGQRRLRHIGRDDNLASPAGCHRFVLLARRHFAVQSENGKVAQRGGGADFIDRPLDFIGARHEDQRVAGLGRVRGQRLGGQFPRRRVAGRAFRMTDLHRKGPPGRFEHFAGREVFFQLPHLQRG